MMRGAVFLPTAEAGGTQPRRPGGDGTVLPHVFNDSHMPVGQVGIVLSATETNHVADAGRIVNPVIAAAPAL